MLKLAVRQAKLLVAVLPLGACVAFLSELSPPVLTGGLTAPRSAVAQAAPKLQTATKSVSLPLRLEIQLSQRRVTLYQGNTTLKSYPIAVGRPGWETPKGTYKVQQRIQNPAWIHPMTGEKVKGGDPENPLGNYWLGFWTDGRNWIGFHGTPTPKSVGTAASHGCIRMYNQDISELFAKIPLGTEVTVRD
ncbi:L,D-transpeptidase [Myxacorys almedinensis]|uniref:L,D-transpeptidase family protein n=1 Tax=Myxacorys almedinensis A TaxID=2690445 RepID=A0A8J7Z704_9CYAN|nr:L,D-transpeptidase [Myxacorys almedinensis]NDJ17578.1 L,D-transpeptidase family protein [Myxacorys almedinensis A]